MMNCVSGGGSGGSPPTVIHSKVRRKSLALRKHPPYLEMVSDAIVTLKGRNGSSQYAIGKFVEEKHKDQLPLNFKKTLLIQLKKLVASHKLVKVKASYKLPSAVKPKPKAAAKKAPAKKKPAAKTKPDAKAKLAPKAKPAAKTVTKKALAKKIPAKAKAGSAKAAAKPNLTPKSFQEAADILGGVQYSSNLLLMSRGC